MFLKFAFVLTLWPASILRGLPCLWILLLFFHVDEISAVESSHPARLLPRNFRPDPITIPIHVLQARSPADNTTFGVGLSAVSMTKDRTSYFAVIKAGGINFRVALDTASSDLWLVSSACETETCRKVPRYPLAYQSPTFVSLNDNTTIFKAQYADNTFASGFVAKEAVQFDNLTISNQAFGVVTDSNVSLTDQTSGIMGLGFPRLSSISGSNFSPFFATLASKALLEYPLFGLSLTGNSTGTLALGAIDSSVVTNVSHVGWNKVAQFPPFGSENNVSSYLQWTIPLTTVAVNGTAFTPISTYANVGRTQSLALFDVGAPGIYGPYQDVSHIYSTISGARLVNPSGQWALPCDTTVPISFTFGLQNYTLLPTDYIIAPASGNPNLCLSWPMALPPNSDGIDWQMGSAFLRTVYSIFSFGINGKEPPLIGLYALHTTNSTQNADDVASFLSANSATLTTTLPNYILSTPTFTTPPLAFNTSISASVGAIVSSELANSTYSALFGQRTSLTNVSALPTITPPPNVVTLVVTNPAGDVSTTISSRSMAAVTLGLPAGWNAGGALHVPTSKALISTLLFVWTWLFLQTH